VNEKRDEPDSHVRSAQAMIDAVARWAALREDIVGLAVVGSHARGAARADSDVDFVVVCADPGRYLANTEWVATFGAVTSLSREDWGKVQSLRVLYRGAPEVEFGIAGLDWTAVPPDAGTARVLRAGCVVLLDHRGLVARVLAAAESTRPKSAPTSAALRWLLDSDPSIRWQALRDLTEASADAVAAERAKVATEGAGARLLALQAPDGRWGGAAWNRGWDSTMHVLSLLREMGLDPRSDEARRALGLVRERVTWRGCGPREADDNAFFAGEVEPCINGQVAAAGAYFGQNVRGLVERLLTEQLADGGWNCEASNGSTRSSFNTTICVLEALLEHEQSVGASAEVTAARVRGQEYLLERRLLRRKSTGEVIERDRKGGAAWQRFAFPTWWHYDVLRALEYLRRAGAAPDERVAEAIELVAGKRDDDGRWPLETLYVGRMPIATDEGEGRPSRWNTLRALRVLRWYSAGR
jgi:hypothetical protein